MTTALAVTGGAGVVLAWLEFVLIRQQLAVGLWVIAVAVVSTCLVSSDAGKHVGVGTSLGSVTVVTQVAWLVTDLHALWVTALAASTALGFYLLASAWAGRSKVSARGVATAVPAVFATAIALVISVVVVGTAASPAPLVRSLHALGQSNSFEPDTQTATTVVDGARLTNDVEYGSTLPNSFLDIYIADDDPSVSRPTYIVIHGGGWIVGDKMDGAPSGNSGGASWAGPMLDAGYNVVSVNYAFAPSYRFPTQTIQLGQAMQFLETNADGYGLDMSRVVLAGTSAGGHIVGNYAAVQTNSDYARALGIEPTIDRSAVKALVFESAALDVGRAGAPQSPSPSNGFFFDIAARSYLDTTDRALLAQANVIDNVTADFPPSFISDGNTGTFPDQAAELSAALDRVGVDNRLNLYSKNEARLDHSFMSVDSEWTDDYTRLKIEFLRDIV
ncbi:alpha/beta hydrolase [Rhodococcus sp. IEGM 1401]|uniref:alpha/beta hydrolase n=1 Tax=unclassified Rhodococcus (in: high G+C Gram-positive bacteria) TaxID=192944 RepID=UPI0022B2F372|nr:MULTISPECIES: alpha/beta hydrolase [unclassified Rhodococcus (in: high G+C Gram-positive bacteria)]MCZ4563914.1 alpha/beta hydrolase [Rhodococcus sp. IEGM 1401]MDI9924036.1 alpha/beta hydrolase [Rhodococcus sp. IEGM 1372]MDV8036503.1 alpha/beta hydrolase [Rhodococcus sp. IEGM 1414]